MDDKLSEGTWAIVTSGPTKYIGRVATAADSFNLQEFKRTLMESTTSWVELNPALDYITHTQISPDGSVRKIPVLTPFDMLADVVPVYVQVTGIVFFDEMQKGDQETYKKFVQATYDQMRKQRLKQETGLEIVGAHQGRR